MDSGKASRRPRGFGRRQALALGLAGTLSLAGCLPSADPSVGVEAPAAESPVDTSPEPSAAAKVAPAPSGRPTAPPPSPTPDPYLAAVAGLSPAERTDDQSAADADWPVPVDPAGASPTPVPRVVDQTIIHVVRQGETLSSIAGKNGVTADAIISANDLGDGNIIYVGQRLAIPTGKKLTVTDANLAAQTLEPHFIWPARAPITTYFHERGAIWKGGWHTGLDIGALYGTPILAAESGLVLEAGWATTRGFGNYVKLDNGLGYNTLYGHMSVIRVKVGQWVNRGDQIGDVGSTGVSTGPHLHFELRINGNPVDPLPDLPE